MVWRCMPSVAPEDWQDLGLVSYLSVVGLGWPYVYYALVRSLVLRKQGRNCAYLPCILDMAS
jgi:hypothetical protein